jgi:signal transduction histidine kinase
LLPFIGRRTLCSVRAPNHCSDPTSSSGSYPRAITDFVERFVSTSDHDRVRRALKAAAETAQGADLRFTWTDSGPTDDSVFNSAGDRASAGTTVVDAGFQRWDQCVAGGPLLVVTLVNRSHERELEDLITHISEDERCRIGEDLHDLIASRVTAVSIRLQNMRHLITDDASGELRQTLDSIIDEVWDVATHVRSLSHTLFPIELEETTLSRALQRCTISWRRSISSTRRG